MWLEGGARLDTSKFDGRQRQENLVKVEQQLGS